jgi:hypothetical protein
MDTRAGRAINEASSQPSRARVISLVLRGGVLEAPPAGAIGGWVLDISALVAFVEGNEYAASVRAMAERTGRTLLVPLPALAAAAQRRPALNPGARLATLLAEPMVVAVDGAVARGPHFDRLVSRASGDRLAAMVVLLATERGWPVLTDRGESLARLRPDLLVIPS